MKPQVDWTQREYSYSCSVREHCRNNNCDWQMTRKGSECDEELKTCPVCGTDTDLTLRFGGLLVHYNSVLDNFVFESPHDRSGKNYVDSADCPDTILFMLKHYRFD